MPDEMELAELVTLYKKGNVEDPANYRPISLLNTLYKIYASILQKRLANGIEDRIWETQYGFRKKKSTAQPLFVTRRLQDQAEITGNKLFLIFLDWEKHLIKSIRKNDRSNDQAKRAAKNNQHFKIVLCKPKIQSQR